MSKRGISDDSGSLCLAHGGGSDHSKTRNRELRRRTYLGSGANVVFSFEQVNQRYWLRHHQWGWLSGSWKCEAGT